MTTFIQAIVSISLIMVMILIVKWEVDSDIKKMEKSLDCTHKELNKNTKATSKDITESILLRAGFNKKETCFVKCPEYYNIELSDVCYIEVYNVSDVSKRNWNVHITNSNHIYIANIYIQTIEHFNKLMELMDIDFRLEDE